MFKLTDEEIDKGFGSVYKSAFDDMTNYHVRPEDKESFLRKMYRDTNLYASSTVWGAVGDLLKEKFGYTNEMLRDLLVL
jgi:hypothetical protein